MREVMPVLLVPGLCCSARLYADQIPALWRFGPVQVADHTRDDSMAAIAAGILNAAPPRFVLVGLSMGGYIALTILTRRPSASISSRCSTLRRGPKRRSRRRDAGRRSRSPKPAVCRSFRAQFPVFVHRNRHGDEALKERVRIMAEETGAQAFLRQQQAIMTRLRCTAAVALDQMSDAGAGRRRRRLTPPDLQEIAAGIAGSRLVVVPDCGHLSTMERPERVNRRSRNG